MDELIRAVKSLISDIESMRSGNEANWFGPFSEYKTGYWRADTAEVEWPNLAISVEAVKKLLEPLTIEGELTKSDYIRKIAEERGLKVVEVKMIETDSNDLLGLPTVLVCSVCGQPQYATPSGLVCVNGHGGA